MNASIFSNVSGSATRRCGCSILSSSRAVVRRPSMFVKVPCCAGISKSSSGKEIVQESDFMIRRLRSCMVVILKMYFDPRG